MKSTRLQTTETSARDKANYNPDRWQVAHALARLIPFFPAPEKTAAVALLLDLLLGLLRRGGSWN